MTIQKNLLTFFQNHPNDTFASGVLQRLEWRGKNGKVQTPRTVVRRLQEMAEDGQILNVGTTKMAVYKLKGAAPKKQEVTFKTNAEGILVAVIH